MCQRHIILICVLTLSVYRSRVLDQLEFKTVELDANFKFYIATSKPKSHSKLHREQIIFTYCFSHLSLYSKQTTSLRTSNR